MEDQFHEVPLENDLNKGHCFAYVALAKDSQEVIGYSLYYYAYSTWIGRFVFLEDLYVKSDYRNQGIGKALWKKVAQVHY